MTRRSQCGLDVELEWAGDSTGRDLFEWTRTAAAAKSLPQGPVWTRGKWLPAGLMRRGEVDTM